MLQVPFSSVPDKNGNNVLSQSPKAVRRSYGEGLGTGAGRSRGISGVALGLLKFVDLPPFANDKDHNVTDCTW